MPLDETLPPSRLTIQAESGQSVRYFRETVGVPVDLEGLDALPPIERFSLAGARLPEPPEAVLLDRVLQLVPRGLLDAVERVVIVPSRGTGREGGARNRIVRIAAQEARLREGDFRYGYHFSLFTTTVLHEVGHVVFEARLTAEQQGDLLEEYVGELEARLRVPLGEPSQQGLEHHFIRFFIAALLGRGEPPLSGSAGRARLIELGLELRSR